LSATAAREVAQLPRGNQLRVAQAVRDHQLTSRQSAYLVAQLLQTTDPLAVREVLADPLRYLATEAPSAKAPQCDPRLSEGGNRLRRVLLNWDGLCGHLTRSLRRHAPAGLEPAEARVLDPVLQQAIGSGRRAMDQLEATQDGRSLPVPSGAGHG
jgi:hypothetical protein